MANYLGSNLIKVYPSGYRGDNINYEASVNSEENLNSLASRLVANKNYIVEAEESAESGADNKIIFVIEGYLFSANKSDITALFRGASENTIIYASVKTINVTTTVAGASGTYRTLIPYDDSDPAVLDNSDVFKGVYFSAESGDLALYKNVSGTWAVVESSKLIFNTTQIQDGTNAKAINEEFHVSKLYGEEDVNNYKSLVINRDSIHDTIVANGSTTLNGTLSVNNQSTGFKITGGTSQSKYLDLQGSTTIKHTTNIYASLDIGDSFNTSKITIKQSSNKTFSLIGALTNAAQTVTFSGTSTFQAGDYSSVSTSGSESIKIGGNTFNVVTRDIAQTISGNKTHSGTISITNSTANALSVTGTSNFGNIVVAGDKSVILGTTSSTTSETIYGDITFNNSDDIEMSKISASDGSSIFRSIKLSTSDNNKYVRLSHVTTSSVDYLNVNIDGSSFRLKGTSGKNYNLGNVIQFVSFEDGILTLKRE